MTRPFLLAAIALLTACSGSPGNDRAGAPPGNAATGPAEAADAVTPAGAPALTGAALASYLPSAGRHEARAMVLAPPAEAVALRDRMVAAIIRNQAWFEAYAGQHPQGELPWHANLGISEADYLRYLALTRQIRLNELARVRLNVTRRPDGGLALAADGAAAALNGILLYPDRGRAQTPLGALGTSRVTGNDAADSPLGRWQGAEWSNRGIHATRLVSLSAGRRAAGDMLLYYNYGPSDAETVILLYPAAATGAGR
jgi:hypothetical protein